MAGMKRSSGAAPISIGIVLVVLPMLYLLAFGPAVYLFESDVISEDTLLTAYAPVAWLVDKSETFGKFIEWYCWLWTPTKQGHP